jgi:hypothetical protein
VGPFNHWKQLSGAAAVVTTVTGRRHPELARGSLKHTDRFDDRVITVL